MKKAFRLAQFIANISLITITPFVVAIAIRQFVYEPAVKQEAAKPNPQDRSKNSPQTPAPIDPLGKTVSLEDVDWKANKRTLVLYLSTTCTYCNASIPFYQRFLSQTEIKVVAVFSQGEAEAASYLASHKIKVDKIVSASLRPIGITGTPSILLVDENGTVSKYWKGKLTPDKEADVIESAPDKISG